MISVATMMKIEPTYAPTAAVDAADASMETNEEVVVVAAGGTGLEKVGVAVGRWGVAS